MLPFSEGVLYPEGLRMVSPWRGFPSNRLRVERVVTELPECARPSSYGGLGLLEPCVLSCVLSAGRIPLRFHHVYRTHATHSVMPVYTRSTFGTDGLAQPIGKVNTNSETHTPDPRPDAPRPGRNGVTELASGPFSSRASNGHGGTPTSDETRTL